MYDFRLAQLTSFSIVNQQLITKHGSKMSVFAKFEFCFMMKKLSLIGGFFFLTMAVFAQKEIPNLALLDVLHYEFQIAVSDTSNEIHGISNIQIHFLKNQLP